MATGTIILSMEAARFPDGSASNAAPGRLTVKSSAAAPTPYFQHLLFDSTTKEQCMWSIAAPADFASGPVLKTMWKMASATTGNVVLEARVAAVSSGDATDADAKAFAAANTSAATSVPGTAGHVKEISITLTNADSMAANDFAVIYLARDAASGSDTASGDLELVMASLQYTTV